MAGAWFSPKTCPFIDSLKRWQNLEGNGVTFVKLSSLEDEPDRQRVLEGHLQQHCKV